MGWEYSQNREEKKWIQSFGGESSCKIGTWKMEVNIKTDFMETGCEDERWMKMGEDRVECREFLLDVSSLGVYYQRVI
jgi:hypothetical protein